MIFYETIFFLNISPVIIKIFRTVSIFRTLLSWSLLNCVTFYLLIYFFLNVSPFALTVYSQDTRCFSLFSKQLFVVTISNINKCNATTDSISFIFLFLNVMVGNITNKRFLVFWLVALLIITNATFILNCLFIICSILHLITISTCLLLIDVIQVFTYVLICFVVFNYR